MKKIALIWISIFLIAVLFSSCTTKSAYKDGTWTAVGTVMDTRGYTPAIEIIIKSGKITSVKYDEFDKDRKLKSMNSDYLKSFKIKEKVDLLMGYRQLQKALIEKQDIAKVDTYTGATFFSNNFKLLAAQALEKAK